MSLSLSARLSSALVTAALALGACGGSSPPAAATTPAATAAADPSCPVEVPGTSVSVEDTSTGAAMVFVTTGDVAELRTRVTAMAAKHNAHHGAMGALPDGTDGGGEHAGHDMGAMHGGGGEHAGHDMSGMHGGGGMIMSHSKAEAADIAGGTRVMFTVAPADVAKIQAELRMHAQHLAGGTCAMEHS